MPSILLSPHPEPGTQALVWELIRGSGLLAYVALSISTILGIAITVRAFDSITKRAYVYEGHQSVSIAALVLTGVHMVMLLFDKFVGFSVAGRTRAVRGGLAAVGGRTRHRGVLHHADRHRDLVHPAADRAEGLATPSTTRASPPGASRRCTA